MKYDYEIQEITSYELIFLNTNSANPLSTPAPARDGSNWFGYAGQNPVMNIDDLRLYQISIYSKYKIQEEEWEKEGHYLKNSDFEISEKAVQ